MKTEKQEVSEVIGVSENQSQDEIFETILGNISKVEFRNLAGELFRIDLKKSWNKNITSSFQLMK